MEPKDNWSPCYGNDSHPWLLASPGNSNKLSVTTPSTMRASYTHPTPPCDKSLRRRRRQLESFLWQQITEQVANDLTKDENEDEQTKETEYTGNFNIAGFQPELAKIDTNSELCMMHPLYTEAPHTCYIDQMKKIKGETASKDTSTVFRRKSFFPTSPLSSLDEL